MCRRSVGGSGLRFRGGYAEKDVVLLVSQTGV